MALSDNNMEHIFTDVDKELNRALENREEKTVLELCERVPQGPNRIITIHGSTVLNAAIYYEEENLSLALLDLLRTDESIKEMMVPNYDGISILHDAATTDRMRRVAGVMLRKAPELLELKNVNGETALFRSASYGKIKMFEFLDEQVGEHLENIKEEDKEQKGKYFYKRKDGSTILHISVLYQHFDLALLIAKRHESLIHWRDGDGMTPLQLLACNPLAFKSGSRQNQLEQLIYSCVSTGDSSASDKVKSCCKMPLVEDIRSKKKTYESAMRLAEFLIEKDRSWVVTKSALEKSCPTLNEQGATESALEESATRLAKFLVGKYRSWEATDSALQKSGVTPSQYEATESALDESAMRLGKFLVEKYRSWEANESTIEKSGPKVNRYGAIIILTQDKEARNEHDAPVGRSCIIEAVETPLFLAAKKGIIEIVREILTKHPLAIEHIDAEGQNILHVAIKYRQMHIFDLIVDERKKTLMRWITRKIDNNGNSILHMVGLKENAEKVEDMRSPAIVLQEDLLLFERINKITDYFYYHRNNKGHTAEEQFAISSSKLRSDAKEWLKRTAENCSIVAVLIATVAFAAAYTVPGGLNQETGYPILINQPFFIVFTMTDVLSLTFALTSVITFLSILTSPFRLKDFKQTLPQKLMLGVTLLILSVSMMMLAFVATFILLIHKKQEWTKIALYAVALIPVSIFVFSYLPLYIELMKTIGYSIQKIGKVLPHFDGDRKSKSTVRSKSIQSPPSCSSPCTQSTGSQTTSSLV
ncbi:hypothetical protein NMG60_11009890 [Bertholletia excelsa]